MTRSTARPTPNPRGGAATVEFCVALIFMLFPLFVGLWDLGRAIEIQQMVSTAAREGARLAAQGRTTTSSGLQTDIKASIAPASNTALQPNVKAAVMQSLAGSGLKGLLWSDVDVVFAFTDGNLASTDPYQGTKNQGFTVKVTVQYDSKVRWLDVIGNYGITSLKSTTKWRMLMDDPFSVNPNVPNW